MPALFEQQVDQTPDAVAIVFKDQQLTYRALNRRANQLAHHLRHLGVGPEVMVGLCVERSVDMLVGMLGILKAGGVYVPLDPSYPSERLEWMSQDCAAPLVLTQQHLATRCSVPAVIRLDADWPTIAKHCAATNAPCTRAGSDVPGPM